MINKIIKVIISILLVIGIILGIGVALKKNNPSLNIKQSKTNVLEMMQTRTLELNKIYFYGKSLGIEGKITNVSKDNFESISLYITDGLEYKREYKLDSNIDSNTLTFTSNEINNEIILDDLDCGTYYVLVKLNLNNSIDSKYYSFANNLNISEDDLNYYSITQDGINKNVLVSFTQTEYNKQEYNLLILDVSETPEMSSSIYDIVIDAGHGGSDIGLNKGAVTEADLTLKYAYSLYDKLTKEGYKVYLTRTSQNSELFTKTNMYDANGRITKACETKAKLMISFHVNDDDYHGLEIFTPCKIDYNFASIMAKNIVENSNLEYSTYPSFKVSDGVYARGFTQGDINASKKAATDSGYEPYNITLDTPKEYTIREVGGVATNAYVDGRNKSYAANMYYNSIHGIECYEIKLGNIKQELDIIQNDMDNITTQITKAIVENY